MASVVTRAGVLDVAGDPSALHELRVRHVVEEHYDFVWRSLRRLGITEESVDDAAQQVFCIFARRATEVAPEKDKTFLFGVVIRVAQNARRCRARRPEYADEERLARVPSEQASPEELLEERRARALLDALLDEMPMELRTVFVLYEIEEMTMVEIARVLDMPNGTVASRLRRARELFETLSAGVRERTSR